MTKLIGNIIERRPFDGMFGLEFEVEGENLPDGGIEGVQTVVDNSLRGGLEYVFRQPVDREQALVILDNINRALEARSAKPTFSFRTSVHVHINVTKLTFMQLKTFLYLLVILEPALLHFSGQDRKHNRFCLGMLDAAGNRIAMEKLFQLTEEEFVPNDDGYIFPSDQFKYAAINIAPIQYQGSVEIRCLRGTLDRGTIDTWLKALEAAIAVSKNYASPEELFNHFVDTGFEETCEDVFGMNFPQFFGPDTRSEMFSQFQDTLLLPITAKE